MSLWGKIFGEDPKKLFLDFDPQGATWSMVTWNFDLNKATDKQWMLEVHKGLDDRQLIQWKNSSTEDVTFYLNTRLIRKRRIDSSREDLKSLMNLSMHSVIKSSLERNQPFMIQAVSGATTQDMQNEFKYLQWIQASFGMVTRALDSMKGNKDLLMTGAFFSGIEPETGDNVLRVIIFNLDIFYYLSADDSLRIVIFDDKNLGTGQSKTPSFQQIIKVTKPQFYDEIVKLVHRIATAGEIV